MPTLFQTVAGVGQFTGLAGAGLFEFSFLDNIPRTSRVVLHIVAYHAEAGGNPGTLFEALYVRPAGAPTQQILLGRTLAAQILGPAGDGDVRYCGTVVPRDRSGQNWELVCRSTGKTVDATVSVDYTIESYLEETEA